MNLAGPECCPNFLVGLKGLTSFYFLPNQEEFALVLNENYDSDSFDNSHRFLTFRLLNLVHIFYQLFSFWTGVSYHSSPSP